MYRHIIILRLADALMVTDSRLVIRVENMVAACTCRSKIPRDLLRAHACMIIVMSQDDVPIDPPRSRPPFGASAG